ncbi:MAG: excisionase family DNA-binding protein [Nitrospira sp.]|nr:excisionase family DNA-binding protein [Nitrospira sp.]
MTSDQKTDESQAQRTSTFPRLLTVPEAAERLCLKQSTIRRLILERRIDTVRPSRRSVRIPERAVLEILKRGYQRALAE